MAIVARQNSIHVTERQSCDTATRDVRDAHPDFDGSALFLCC
jgi:hypothetical protein